MGKWVRSWWRDSEAEGEKPRENMVLTEVIKDNPFNRYKVERPRLRMPPPTVMETIMKVFNEDRMAHPRHAHVFVIPRLMTHLWRRQSGKDADTLAMITAGDHFWDKSKHKPQILAIILPFAFVENYRGPWTVHRLEKPESLQRELVSGFKITVSQDRKEFPHIYGELCRMWQDPEGRSWAILLHFFDCTGISPCTGVSGALVAYHL